MRLDPELLLPPTGGLARSPYETTAFGLFPFRISFICYLAEYCSSREPWTTPTRREAIPSLPYLRCVACRYANANAAPAAKATSGWKLKDPPDVEEPTAARRCSRLESNRARKSLMSCSMFTHFVFILSNPTKSNNEHRLCCRTPNLSVFDVQPRPNHTLKLLGYFRLVRYTLFNAFGELSRVCRCEANVAVPCNTFLLSFRQCVKGVDSGS